jgi:hypothetical protein
VVPGPGTYVYAVSSAVSGGSFRFLEEEIWPLVPPDRLGKPVSKAEREEIPGFGEHGA